MPMNRAPGRLFGWAKYAEVFRISVANRVAYPAESLSRPLFFSLILFVFLQLWRGVFAGGRPMVAGFGLRETLWYLIITEGILLSTPVIAGKMDEEIKTGSIAYLISRPLNYVWYCLWKTLGECFALFFLNLSAGIAMGLLLVGPIPVSFAGLVALFPAIALAFVLYNLIGICIALLAFWVEDARPFFWIFGKLLFICGGLMIPLDFFPEWLRRITDWLPFRHILYEPAKALIRFAPDQAVKQLALQSAWILFFLVIAQLMYARGLKKVSIHGG
jgi:ABC-2 type transport system permease protein